MSTSEPRAAYVSVAPLARGGMGSVDLVLRKEGDFARLYARKRPIAAHERASTFRAHFLREARVAGLLRHPNVVSVLDVGEDADGPYLVMDFVEGPSLAALIKRFRQNGELLPLGVCVSIAKQLADGLHAAHELRGHDGVPVALVHRDVSPQNVLLDYQGIARVTDFGLAKALGGTGGDSTSDVLKGKVGYMSPEQLRFEPIDRRSDLWALGVVLYEMLTCERLFPGSEMDVVARRILSDPPPDVGAVREDAPPELTELVFDLLAKDRTDRPTTAAEVSRRLGDILRTVEASEGAIELADFLDTHFAREREEAAARRATQIAAAERSVAVASSLRARAGTVRARRRWVIAASVAIVLVASGWLVLREGDRSQPGPAAAPPAPAPAPVAASAPEPDAARTEEVVETETPGAEEAVAPPDEPEPTRAARRDRRTTKRGDGDRLWSWP